MVVKTTVLYNRANAENRRRLIRSEAEYAPTVKERPGLVIFGKTIKEKTPWGNIYVTLNFDSGKPFETFITVGKSGSELKAMTEALSRVISIALRSGCRLEDLIGTLKGLSGKEVWMFDYDDEHVIRSIPDAISVLLEKLAGQGRSVTSALSNEGVTVTKPKVTPLDKDKDKEYKKDTTTGGSSSDHSEVACPECGAPMELISGCAYCFSCGYSPCK